METHENRKNLATILLQNLTVSGGFFVRQNTTKRFDSHESCRHLLEPMKSLSELSVTDLRRVIALKEQIEALEGQLEALIGEAEEASPTKAAPAKRPKRRLSAAHRRKLIKALARARKIRWAKAKATGTKPASKKRRMSAAGRAAMSAAAKARWAKVRAAKAA